MARVSIRQTTRSVRWEVDEHNILNAEIPPDYIFPADRAVYQRNIFIENKCIRVDIKAENRGHSADLGGALVRFIHQCGVTDMHTVKKSKGYRPLYICHQLTSKKLFIVFIIPFWASPSIRNAPCPE